MEEGAVMVNYFIFLNFVFNDGEDDEYGGEDDEHEGERDEDSRFF